MKCKLVTLGLVFSCFSGMAQTFDTDTPVGWAVVPGYGLEGITGGGNGRTVVASTAEDFIQYVRSSEPLIVKVEGTITGENIQISVSSNKTIIGIGDSATIVGIELGLSDVSNIIVRNLTIKESRDAIALRRSHHVWIDHCDVSNCYDGLIDITDQSDLNTVSWTRFSNHDKTMLINSGTDHDDDIGTLNTTIHHNWWDGSNQRNPRVGYGKVHVFNCRYNRVLDEDPDYGIGLHSEGKVLAESNYFENYGDPIQQMYIMDPSSKYHGFCESVNNIFNNCRGKQDDEGVSFRVNDYYLYDFVLDSATNVSSKVKESAGPGAEYSELGLLPVPGQGAVIQNSNPTLSWTRSENASAYIVSFGTSFPLSELATVTEPKYSISGLEPGVVCYWRVDQQTPEGIVTGKIWTFRNGAVPGMPVGSIVSPINDTLINSTDEIPIITRIPASDDSKLTVEFYDGKILLGTDTSAPYSLGWTNISEGSHILSVKIKNEAGLVYVSDFVVPVIKFRINGLPDGYDLVAENGGTCSFSDVMNIAYGSGGVYSFLYSVVGNVGCNAAVFGVEGTGNGNSCYAIKTSSPYIGIISPSSGKTYKELANISIVAKALDNEGDIDSVGFYNGEELITVSKINSTGVASCSWKNLTVGEYNISARVKDFEGHTTISGVSHVVVESGSGSDLFNQSVLNIYPNPVTDFLTIDLNPKAENSMVSIADLQGNLIFEQVLQGCRHQIDLRAVPAGVYFVTLSGKMGISIQKFLKQ